MGRSFLIFQLALLVTWLSSSLLAQGAQVDPASVGLYYSKWYDRGLFGIYPRQWYKSFKQGAPLLNFLQWDDRCDTGMTFMAPRGVMVYHPGPVVMDAKGELVWMEDKYGQAMDFKMQHYKGQDYLTFWRGKDGGNYGIGSYLMLDSSYEVYKNITPANGGKGDLHEFNITEDGTALMTMYDAKPFDLSPAGGPVDGYVFDSVFQEMDIETGDLIFEWRASEHYAINESYFRVGKKGTKPEDAVDFFHINSIDKDAAGNYIICSRYMKTVTWISPKGEILYILGGHRNMFTDLSGGAATDFSWQHHVRIHENNTLTIFDNGRFMNGYDESDHSRALYLQLDFDNMTVELLHAYVEPHSHTSPSQGSVQMLPNGNILTGWGYYAAYTEFSVEGEALCNVHIGPEFIFNLGWVKSYRNFRVWDWVGKPSYPPSLYLRPRDHKVYVSWNGATEVDSWMLQGSDDREAEGEFLKITTVKKEKFETAIEIGDDMEQYIRVAALDKAGNILGHTEILKRSKGNAPSELWKGILSLILGAGVGFWIWMNRISIQKSKTVQRVAQSTIVRQILRTVGLGAAKTGSILKGEEMMPLYADDDVEEELEHDGIKSD